MELAINITSACRIRVLLVPVGPIKKSTFWKHVELVKQFAMVRLGDVTPDLKKDSTGTPLMIASNGTFKRFNDTNTLKTSHVQQPGLPRRSASLSVSDFL